MASLRDRLPLAAFLAVVAGLAGAYFLGADRASEVRTAVDGVRRHETALESHEKRLGAHDAALESHGKRLDAHDGTIREQGARLEATAKEAATARALSEEARREAAAALAEARTVAAVREDVDRLRSELDALKADLRRRDEAHGKLLERIERMERVLRDRDGGS